MVETDLKEEEAIDLLIKKYKLENSYISVNSEGYVDKLYLSERKIKKIEGLENFSHLKLLDLRDNQITKIEGLESFSQLQTLNLSYNQIMKIEGFEDLL